MTYPSRNGLSKQHNGICEALDLTKIGYYCSNKNQPIGSKTAVQLLPVLTALKGYLTIIFSHL